MQLLTYFNVVTRSFTTIIEPHTTRKKVGDMYKVNNVLLSILELEVKQKPLKLCRRKLKDYKGKVGDAFIRLGKSIKNEPTQPKVIYKYKNQWWKR